MFSSFQNLFAAAANAAAYNAAMAIPAYEHKAFRCFPVVMANKANLENGDKIILPASSLDHLARLRVTYPMMFRLVNKSTGQSTHCGVMEFSAEVGVCYATFWLMQNLLLESGSIVDISNVTLPKGTFVKFQPHTTKFTQLTNPRAVLENALRNFSCLTKDQTIAIQHGDETFHLDVLEVKPGNAISIVETDVNVDFAPPKDYKEEEFKRPEKKETNSTTGSPAIGSSGNPPLVFKSEDSAASDSKSPQPAASAAPSSGKDYFAKLGSGNRLSGKPANNSNSSPGQGSTAGSGGRPLNSSLSLSPSASSSSSASATSPTSSSSIAREVVESVGQWDYIYSVDAKGVKKLLKRVPAGQGKTKPFTTTKGYSMK